MENLLSTKTPKKFNVEMKVFPTGGVETIVCSYGKSGTSTPAPFIHVN